jgi:tRNA (cmo5U34)-methyltransferase
MQKNDNLTAHSASSYDNRVRESIPNYDAFHTETINLVSAYMPDPRFWVDTGGGTGTLVLKAHPKFTGAEFFLADPSPAMLDLAREKLRGMSRITILPPVDTAHLEPPEKADVVTAIQAHHYAGPDVRKLSTQKCFEILRPDGLFVTFENVRPLTEAGTKIGKEYWRRYQEMAGKTDEEARKHIERFGKEYQPITVEEHLALLRSSGFRVVELLWYSYLQAGFYCVK